MKRIVGIGAIVVVLAAAGWGLFWWLGRDALVRAFDDEVARLEASGWTIDWADRQIGGFPFGYTMRLTEVEATEPASGFRLRLPHATAETEGVGGVLIRMPETFAADLPAAPPDAAPQEPAPQQSTPQSAPQQSAPQGAEPSAEPSGVPVVTSTAGEASEFVVRLSGTGGAGHSLGVEAQSLIWRMRLPGSPREQVLSFDGLDAGMTMRTADASFRLQAARYGVDAALVPDAGPPSTMAASYRDVTVTATTTVPTGAALVEMLYAGAPGQLDLAVQTGGAEASLVGGRADRRGTLDWQAGSLSGVATLTSGRLDLQGEARQNVWTLTPETPGELTGGQLSAGMVQATYSMPMAPAPRPDDMAIRLALLDVALDEAAWQAIDPEGALPRDAAEFVIDLGGLARVTRRIDAMRPGEPPPFEVSEIDVNEISLDALGATVRASGKLEILQPIGLPLGTLDVGLTGVAGLVGALGRAGLLTPEMVEMADAMLTVYARPAGGEDAWTTDVTFTNTGPQVNGLPIR